MEIKFKEIDEQNIKTIPVKVMCRFCQSKREKYGILYLTSPTGGIVCSYCKVQLNAYSDKE